MSDFFKSISEGLSYDDVYLVPDYSNINSRSDVDVSISMCGINSKFPFMPANMNTITEHEMISAVCSQGGIAAFHRYIDPSELLRQIKLLSLDCMGRWGISVGVNWDWTRQVFDLIEKNLGSGYWPSFVIIDVAHGDHKLVIDAIKRIYDSYPINQNIKIIAGNVCTAHGAIRLVEAGADIIKCGVGPGSVCTTRIVTGCGYPQLSTVMNVTSGLRKHFDHYVPVIADGGIKYYGDAVKAIAAGADMVMLGGIFAGCEEAPGEVDSEGYKEFQGMASARAQSEFYGVDPNQIAEEGTCHKVSNKGPVKNIIHKMKMSMASGFSYCGCGNVRQLQAYGRETYAWVRVSPSAKEEGHPHGVKRNGVL